MERICNFEMSGVCAYINISSIPPGMSTIKMVMSEWPDKHSLINFDLDVSYDDCRTWEYGGGAKGGSPVDGEVSFKFTYPRCPTHVRGQVESDGGLIESSGYIMVGI